MFRVLGGMRARGESNIPLDGPVILAPTHFSFLDPPLVACGMKRAITFMAKEELFKPFLFGPLIRSLGAFPISRGSGDTEAIRSAIKLLGEGRCMVMFPEGTRGKGEILGPITPGIAMLAKKSGAAVVPIAIRGTHLVLPKGAKMPKPSRMTVSYGRPIYFKDFLGEHPDKVAREHFNTALADSLLGLSAEIGLPLRIESSQSALSESLAPETSPVP